MIFSDFSESATITAFMPVLKDADRYNMNHKNRGKCVIFNHEEFEMTGFDRREGSSTDAMKLEKTFGNLGFDVNVHDNFTYREVIDVLDEREYIYPCFAPSVLLLDFAKIQIPSPSR